MVTPPAHRAGVAAIVGRANVGKSSLLNAILGEQVSVVSPVAQTTRRPVRGIYCEDNLQIVFLDTPGIRQATHALGSLLNRTARGLVTGSDAVLLLLQAVILLRSALKTTRSLQTARGAAAIGKAVLLAAGKR